MNKFEQIQNKENKENKRYELLKEGLVSGDMSLEAIAKQLIEFDQSTPSRELAKDNVDFLKDKEVVDFVQTLNPEVVKGYHRLLSFFEFHVAQQLANKNTEEAKEFFQNSLEDAKQGGSKDDWLAYIEGTLLYINGQTIPEDIIDRVTEPRNAKILKRFNNGLRERNGPDYDKDYNK